MRRSIAKLAFDRGGLLAAAIAIVYVWLAPSHIVAADNAELATLGAIGGHAHPSGYPLYILWLRVMSWLPCESAAHRAALATVVLAVAQAIVLHAACRAWGARATAATIAVAIFAAAPFVIRVHSEADVFALNSLVASAILWLSASDGPLHGTRRAAALGLVAGLGLANNLTCVLLAPVGLLGVVRALRETTTPVRGGVLVVIGVALGLTPYLYLFVAPDAASWAPVDTFGELVDTFLRRDYGTTSHLPSGAGVALATSLGAYAVLLGRIWLWVPALIGLASVAVRTARDRWGWGMLALSWLLTGPVLAWRIDIEPHGVGAYIGGRMLILSAVVLAVPIAVGFDAVARRIRWRPSRASAAAIATAGFIALALTAVPQLARVHSAAMELGVRNMLGSLPARAIVLATSEDQCFGARYLQLVERDRPDVVFVCWTLATRDWYRARIARSGVAIGAQRGGPASLAQGEALLASGRPLIVDQGQSEILAQLPSYPVGVLFRILPPGAVAPSLSEVVKLNQAIYERFELDDARPTRADDFAAIAHLRYASTWARLARDLEAAGDSDGAAAAAALARQLAPTD